MPGIALLGAAVVVNLARHRRGQPTICQEVRAHVPKPVAAVLLSAGFGWLLPHLLEGYPREAPGHDARAS